MDKPPSDPADHAEDFGRRYAEDLDIVAGQTMLDLGIDTGKIGARPRTQPGAPFVLPRRPHRGERIAPEDLVHLSPARYDHVNPYGRYQFRVDRWAGKRPLRPIKV